MRDGYDSQQVLSSRARRHFSYRYTMRTVPNADDGAGVAGAAPSAGEQGKAVFAEAAGGSRQHVEGLVVDVQLVSVPGLSDRGVDADSGSLVGGAGQGGLPNRFARPGDPNGRVAHPGADTGWWRL